MTFLHVRGPLPLSDEDGLVQLLSTPRDLTPWNSDIIFIYVMYMYITYMMYVSGTVNKYWIWFKLQVHFLSYYIGRLPMIVGSFSCRSIVKILISHTLFTKSFFMMWFIRNIFRTFSNIFGYHIFELERWDVWRWLGVSRDVEYELNFGDQICPCGTWSVCWSDS